MFAGVLQFFRAPLVAEVIPDLRPMEELLPPTFREQHGSAILLMGLLALVVSMATVWWRRRVRPTVLQPPVAVALEALRKLESEPENGALACSVLQVLRRYFAGVMPKWPHRDLTAEEMVLQLNLDSFLHPELINEITALLRRCEQRQFYTGRLLTSRLAGCALGVVRNIEAARAKCAGIPGNHP